MQVLNPATPRSQVFGENHANAIACGLNDLEVIEELKTEIAMLKESRQLLIDALTGALPDQRERIDQLRHGHAQTYRDGQWRLANSEAALAKVEK